MSVFMDFEPFGRRGECQSGLSILECARFLGVNLINVCGGQGNCGSCVVRILLGKVSPISETELEHLDEKKIAGGYRLACLTIPETDCKVCTPPESLTTHQRTQVEGQNISIDPDPVVKKFFVVLPPPGLDDTRSDAERLTHSLKEKYGFTSCVFDFSALLALSNTLRENNYRVNAMVRENEIISVLPKKSSPIGLAVDLGTTKIAVYLMDLETGRTMNSRGLMNPQIIYGEDIISRIVVAQESPDNAKRLQQLVVDVLNETISVMCEENKKNADEIVEVVLVGNTAMHHIILGLEVRQLGRAPFISGISSSFDVKAREIGLHCAPGAYIHFLPHIAGFVGADHVAMLLATEILKEQGIVLAVDIGTNTEICLVNNGVFTSLSTASGPAFEGANIKNGMRAAAGAIEKFRIVEGKNHFRTIEDAPAAGLCGSGIMDILSQLLTSGIIDRRGKLQDHPRVRSTVDGREYVIQYRQKDSTYASDITFTQKDIEQLQLAKGAIRTGINILLRNNGLAPENIDRIVLAGAFGTYLDVTCAITVGMLPAIPVERIHQVGNAAGMGAKLALISKSKRIEAKLIAQRVRYVELAADSRFPKTFAKAMFLG